MARGGYRIGSGRKKGSGIRLKSPDTPVDIAVGAGNAELDPLSYMLAVMNDPKADKDRRDRMAIAAAPFCHARAAEGKSKKQEQEKRAKTASFGKFRASSPPLKLVK